MSMIQSFLAMQIWGHIIILNIHEDMTHDVFDIRIEYKLGGK